MGPHVVPSRKYRGWEHALIQTLYDSIWSDQVDIHKSSSGSLVRLQSGREGVGGQLHRDELVRNGRGVTTDIREAFTTILEGRVGERRGCVSVGGWRETLIGGS